MIKQIVINADGYKDFELLDLTKNTIMIFKQSWIKNRVARRIAEIWEKDDDEDSSIIYGTSLLDEDKPSLDLEKENINYLQTTVVNLKGGQRFTFTTEPPFILLATNPYDVWFVDSTDEAGNEEITCWAFTDFIGHKDDWDKGIWHIYKNFCNGVYGCC